MTYFKQDLLFFTPKENIKQRKKFPIFSLWDLWVKVWHPCLTARLIENDKNSKYMFSQKSEIISLISTSCVIYMVARILRSCKERILFLGRHVSSRKWAPYSPHLYNNDDYKTKRNKEKQQCFETPFHIFFFTKTFILSPLTHASYLWKPSLTFSWST